MSGRFYVPYLCVYASQVAVCIGANRHKKASEALEAMWQRISPESFHAALARNCMRTEEQIAADLITRAPAVKALVDKTLAPACESSDAVAQKYDSVSRELGRLAPCERLSAGEERLVDDVLKRNLYTAYGTQHEPRALAHIRETMRMDVHPDPTFYKQRGGTVRGVPWYIGGKIDAITADRSLLVEIKSRINRLFYRVPFYEVVQVQTYLQLLDVDDGMLVECLNSRAAPAPSQIPPGANHTPGSNHTPARRVPGEDMVHINTVPIRRDRELWHREIVPKLSAFLDYLLQIIDSPKMQDRYLQSPRRSVLIMSHISQHVR